MKEYDIRQLPIEFTYGGRPFKGFPESTFLLSDKTTEFGENRKTCLCTFKTYGDPLTVRVKITDYKDYNVSEWTVWFINNSDTDTGIIGNIAAHMNYSGSDPVLKGILGDHENSYAPYEKVLSQGPVKFISDKGRPTHIYFPYFNLEYGNTGTIMSIGWGGTWTAEFKSDRDIISCRLSGINGLETYLKPGEEIRTPLFTFLQYGARDENIAANKWRRWFIDCSMPRSDSAGAPVKPFSTTWLAGDTGLPNSDGSISERYFTWKPSIDKMLSEGYTPDFRWFDAGWYCDPSGNSVQSDWWGTVGTWELDKEKWPGNSFRESTDYARKHNMKTLVWFEPERVTHIEELAKNYGYDPSWAIGGSGNDIGNPDCYNWLLNRIKKMLGDNKVEMYREDNNFDIRPYWTEMDNAQGPGRIGITENKAVCAHYRMWDEIVSYTASNGGCAFCDSCASGGGRNDLESLRRGIPLLRSDSDRTSTSLRLSMSSTFLKWVPFCGAACTEQLGQLDPDGKRDHYIFRASWLPILNLNAQWTQDPDTDFDLIRWGLSEWKKISRYLLKDFYTLSSWHDINDTSGWTGFEFLDPESGEGILLLFRMETSEDDKQTFRLKGLCSDTDYIIIDEDSGAVENFTGAELENGYTVSAPQRRTAFLKFIRKA